jgi:cytochrome b561
MITHHTLAWTLVGVAVLHGAAALKHHFWHKDDVLRRMLPFTRQ